MKRLLAVSVAIWSAVVAPASFAQEPARPQAGEAITVEVVDVPVYVLGPNGPVSNLTKNDFELYVNGKRQQIDYFDTIDFKAPARTSTAPAARPRDMRDRRLFLLLFDMMFSRPAALARAQQAAVAMIRHAGPADYFSVATFTASRGAQFVTPFTNDAIANARAVLKLRPSDAHDPLGVAISSIERDATGAIVEQVPQQTVSAGQGKDAAAIAELQEVLGVGADLKAMPMKRLIVSQVTDLTEISARLAQLEGYKHVVFLSEGFSPNYASGMRQNLGQTPPDVDPRLFNVIEEMGRAFHAAGAFLDTIDLGLRDANSTDTLANESLHMLAAATGGQFIHGENDLTKALARVTNVSGTGYRLGFRPGNVRRGDNSIDVKVHNVPSTAIVSFRRGFSTTTATPTANIDPLRLADIILNNTPQTGTPPKIGFGEKPYLLVGVPAEALVAQNGHKPLTAQVLFYIFDASGKAVVSKEKKLPIPVSAKGDFIVRNAVTLPSGDYTAKVLLVAGESVGFNRQSFRIP